MHIASVVSHRDGATRADRDPDGVPATESGLVSPEGALVRGDGTLLVSDAKASAVRAISVDGTVTTFAGTGTYGDSGDGGPAMAAAIEVPGGLAEDSSGNVYVSDRMAHRIRRVAPDGTPTTLAGTGATGYSGDGGPARLAQLRARRRIGLRAGRADATRGLA